MRVQGRTEPVEMMGGERYSSYGDEEEWRAVELDGEEEEEADDDEEIVTDGLTVTGSQCLPSYEESQGSVKAASCMTEAQGDSATEHPSSVCQFFDAPEEATTGTIRHTARQGRDEFSNIDLSLSEQDDTTGEYEEITFEESHRARVAQAGIGPHTRGRIAVSQPIGIRRFLSRRTSTREPTFPERPISPSSLGVAIVSERVNQLPRSNHHKPGA
ncbi:hypothetical protein B0J12DRAFT_669149 [Macrophomina phaseolina]|uniref:Uncharacterized protein n=1 Tax=Macrophomina phaseolina TaxID=35725 RepID=A0ABQ8G620_9PEZI|nr:hypothetical protein B0J12DRAFT_669149 [Macrophomina phaseolina]